MQTRLSQSDHIWRLRFLESLHEECFSELFLEWILDVLPHSRIRPEMLMLHVETHVFHHESVADVSVAVASNPESEFGITVPAIKRHKRFTWFERQPEVCISAFIGCLEFLAFVEVSRFSLTQSDDIFGYVLNLLSDPCSASSSIKGPQDCGRVANLVLNSYQCCEGFQIPDLLSQ